jgi:hypothetical protein
MVFSIDLGTAQQPLGAIPSSHCREREDDAGNKADFGAEAMADHDVEVGAE